MKNTLTDLNNHLFEQMERLNDEDLPLNQLETEIKRAKAMSSIASNIFDNATLGLEAEKLKVTYGHRAVELPEMLENKNAQVHR